MNDIPADLRDFDFIWSSCALEHIGSIRHGLDFIRRAMACLKPGGWAVHTTEFNLTSNGKTLESPGLSFFRLYDLETVAAELRQEGHDVVPFNFNPGDTLPDHHVDLPPFDNTPEAVHLRLKIAEYTITSVGLVIRKNPAMGGKEARGPAEAPPHPTEASLTPFLAAIEANPKDPGPFLGAASLLEHARDFDTARKFLEVGLDQNPQSALLWQALIDQSTGRGDATGAAKDAWDALAQLPSGGEGEWHLRVVRALLAQGATGDAQLVLDKGLRAFPQHPILQQLRNTLSR
jgi:hypothetical protein